MPANIKIGTYIGDGAAQNIQIGFEPQMVIIVNSTDRTGAFVWDENMGDGEAMNLGAGTAVAANGVTPYAGAVAGNSKGFTVGTSLSTSAKVYTYIAAREAST